MAKRYQPPRDFARNIKKPKLDISINKGRPPPQQQQQLRTPCSPKDDFWDDGEDDVLLLATQVAETAASQKRGGVSEAVFSISESAELTFSEFAPNAATSTQRPVPVAAKAMHQDILSQMFDDDDDFDLLAAEKLPSMKVAPAGRAKSEGENVFKKPGLPVVAVARNANSMPENGGVKEIKATAPSAATEPEPEALSQSQARRQLASERQIKFLMDRLDALKKENLKLSTELDDSKSKIVTKEGEASLLRDELKHIKHQMHSLKMEKILSTESAKSESKSKIAELAKQVEAKKTELQLKAVECLQLKQQHAEVTQRFEMSMRNESMFIGDLAAPVAVPQQPVPQKLTAKQKFEAKKRRLDLLKLRGLPQASETICSNASCMPEPKASSLLYKDSAERVRECGMGIMATVLQKQWRALRTTVAELQLAEKQSALSPMEAQECTKKIFSAAAWTLNELSTLSDSLPVQNCRVYPSHDYELLSDYSERQRVSLLQPQPLYDDEQAILMRRFFGALALLCRQYGFVAKAMFDCIREESCALEGELFLLAAAKRICRIGYSTELVQHFGLLESFAALLHSLLLYALSREAKDPLSEEQQLQLAQLLKELIFTRPSVWLLRELSFCVGLCVRLPTILNFFCQHSESAAFRAEPVRSTCEFTKDSCLLQVYSSLLEIAFPLSEPIRAVHFELLTVICQNHLKFVHYCFTSPPKFIHEQLPCYDDDDEEGASSESASNESESNAFMMPANNFSTTATAGSTMTSNSVSSTLQSSSTNTTTQSSVLPTANGTRGGISCECYNRLCLSVVTLVYQVLRHWLRTEQREQFTSEVGQISRIAVQVLHIIFCDNYLTSLFRDAEDTTKHYLHLICKWLEEQQQPLRFQAIHLNFLTKLQTSHIMPKHISVDANIANITADLADWCRITNDSVDSSSISNEDNLSLMESAFDESGFFEGLKGYAFNFQ